MRRILALLMSVSIPFCLQPLSGQTPRIGVQKKKTQTTVGSRIPLTDQRGSDATPFIVETHSRPDSPTEAAKRDAENNTRAYRDSWGFKLTILNAIFTGILMFVGIGGVALAIRSLRALELQTKATQDSVAVLINGERAWIIPEAQPSEILSMSSPSLIRSPNQFLFTLTNKGKTVARVTELNAAHTLVSKDAVLPDEPQYVDEPNDKIGSEQGSVVVPEEFIPNITVGIDEEFDEDNFSKLRSGDLILYVYGYAEVFRLC